MVGRKEIQGQKVGAAEAAGSANCKPYAVKTVTITIKVKQHKR